MGQRPAFVADGGKVTEALKRGLARRLGRMAFTFQPADEQVDVRAKLVVHFIIHGRPPEQPDAGTKQLSHLTQGGARVSSLSPSTPTARTARAARRGRRA